MFWAWEIILSGERPRLDLWLALSGLIVVFGGMPQPELRRTRQLDSRSRLVIITVQESARRSILLTSLGYPLVVAGIILLVLAVEDPGAALLGSGVFLIGINELCLYIARSSALSRTT